MANDPHNPELPKTVSAADLEPGIVISGRYEITTVLGRGGMATVFVAADRRSNNAPIALKALHPEYADDPTQLARFEREVALLNKINHPNVVRTFEMGNDRGLVYFTMEYVRGESIERLTKRHMFSPPEIAKILLGVCDGLTAIHAEGIIHRDLKPANLILAPSGLIKIIDFGVAREKVSTLTTKMQKVGSMYYMAPEVWLGRSVPTPAVDFYSLGVSLYEITTHKLPFDAEYPGEMMRLHLDAAPRPPQHLRPDVPAWLSALILTLLEKDPNNRPAKAEEIIDFLVAHAAADLEKPTLFDSAVSKRFVNPPEPLSQLHPAADENRKTYHFQLKATRVYSEAELKATRPRPKATITLPLPRRAALVFEIEAPSKDFLFFGIFLASLQLFDGVLTAMGIQRFTTHAEGNPMLRYFMHRYGPQETLFAVKAFAIACVALMTLFAARSRWIKNTMKLLCGIYLGAAILPWLYLLYLARR